MTYPKMVLYPCIAWLETISIKRLAFLLVLIYLFLIVLFSFLFFWTKAIDAESNIDYLFFAVVTATTLGYGNQIPTENPGKIIDMFFILITYFYYPFMMSLIFLKFTIPSQAIYFSKFICYNLSEKVLRIRLINVSKLKLINPEVRILFLPHAEGTDGVYSFPIESERLTWIGDRDITIPIDDLLLKRKEIFLGKETPIFDELCLAQQYNQNITSEQLPSRFCIEISVSGYFGFSQHSATFRYKETDFILGNNFQRIDYNNKSKKDGYLSAKFWDDFDKIV